MDGGVDGCALRGFGACAPAAALRLKVAHAAFSERALWVVRAGAELVSWSEARWQERGSFLGGLVVVKAFRLTS